MVAIDLLTATDNIVDERKSKAILDCITVSRKI